jgi:hypothetical protein
MSGSEGKQSRRGRFQGVNGDETVRESVQVAGSRGSWAMRWSGFGGETWTMGRRCDQEEAEGSYSRFSNGRLSRCCQVGTR